MALDPITNFAIVTVSTGYAAGATTIVLATGEGAKLPSTFSYNVVWWNATDYANPSSDPNVEIVRVTNRVTDTLTVTRGQEGTVDANHNTGGKTYKMLLAFTKKSYDDISNLIVDVQASPKYYADRNAVDQSIPVATYTKIAFNNEVYDTHGKYDAATNYRFTPGIIGYYLITSQIFYTLITVDKNLYLYIYKNGVAVVTVRGRSIVVNNVNLSITCIVYLDANDYIEIYTYHSDTVAGTVTGLALNSYVCGSRLI